MQFPTGGIAEHAAPVAERQVRGDDERDALVEFADQMDQQSAAVIGARLLTGLIEHDDLEVPQPLRTYPTT
jgi:hypothetical protein